MAITVDVKIDVAVRYFEAVQELTSVDVGDTGAGIGIRLRHVSYHARSDLTTKQDMLSEDRQQTNEEAELTSSRI